MCPFSAFFTWYIAKSAYFFSVDRSVLFPDTRKLRRKGEGQFTTTWQLRAVFETAKGKILQKCSNFFLRLVAVEQKIKFIAGNTGTERLAGTEEIKHCPALPDIGIAPVVAEGVVGAF